MIIAPYLDADNMETLRVVNAQEALFLADAILLTLFFARLGGAMRSLRWLNLLWIPTLVILQHRSVWVAAIGAIAAALVLQRENRVRFNPTQVVLGAAVAATILVAAILSGRGTEAVASAVGDSARRGVMLQDTASWRLKGWQDLLKRWSAGGPDVLAIGFPMGFSMDRYTDPRNRATLVSVGAHNAYVQILYNSGIIGLACFLVFFAHEAWALKKLGETERCRTTSRALLALLVCMLLFYIPYGLVPLQTFLMGIAYGYVRSNEPETQLDAVRASH